MEEVLDRLPETIRDFLYRISVLDRFSASLCDAVLDAGNSDRLIAQLRESNLFIVTLDDDRRWFRLHHLFGDFLRHASTIDPEERRRIHQKASDWFEDQGEYVAAIEQNVQAERYLDAARIIAKIGSQLLEQSELAKLIRLIEALPSNQACSYPWVCIYHAWALRLTGGGYDEVEHLIDCAEESSGLLQQGDQPKLCGVEVQAEDEVNRMKGHLTAIRAYQALYREDIPAVLRLTEEALRYRPEGNFIRSSIALAQGWAYRFSGDLDAAINALEEARSVGLESDNKFLAVSSTCRLAYTYFLQGKLIKAEQLCQEALQVATLPSGKWLPVAGYVQVYLGIILYSWNRFNEAKLNLTQGIKLCQQVGYVFDQLVGYATLARVHQREGEHQAAQEALDQAEQLSGKMRGYLYAQRWMEDSKVRIWCVGKQWQELKTWIAGSGLGINDPPTFLREVEQLILVRAMTHLLISDNTSSGHEELLRTIEKIQQAVHEAGWVSKEIEALILHSITLQHLGETKQALQFIEYALQLAGPENHLSPFLDEGVPIRSLLEKLSPDGRTQDIHSRLIASFERGARGDDRGAPEMVQRSLIEPLSRRELEVLELLANELSGPEIAEQLFIAISTFRYHTNQIYTKLAVHSRREAVARARELDLI
jgi:LuxR family maltose regulon positive regulatory protein